MERVSIKMMHVKLVFRSSDDLPQSPLQSRDVAITQLPEREAQVNGIACQAAPFDFALVHDAEDSAGPQYPEALANHHRGVAHVIEGGYANRAVEGVFSKRKVFGHAQQKRKAVVVSFREPQWIDSEVGLPIGEEALIEAGTTAQIEDPTLRPNERKEAALKPGSLALLFCEITTVESIEK
jgi:hypothetical protein